MPIVPYYPDSAGPSDPEAAIAVVIIFLVIAGIAGGLTLWHNHHEKHKQQSDHRH